MTNYDEARQLRKILPSISTGGQFLALFADYLQNNLTPKDIKSLGEGLKLHVPIQNAEIVKRLNECTEEEHTAILNDLPDLFEVYGWEIELSINTLLTDQPFVQAAPYVLSVALLGDPDDLPDDGDDDPIGDEDELEEKAPLMAMAARA